LSRAISFILLLGGVPMGYYGEPLYDEPFQSHIEGSHSPHVVNIVKAACDVRKGFTVSAAAKIYDIPAFEIEKFLALLTEYDNIMECDSGGVPNEPD
jgi:hypothetical protein